MIAIDAARVAADLLLRRFRSGPSGVDTKSSATDMVSEADREAEAAIVTVIARARPDDAILGEESGTTSGTSGIRWVIDPLDGTTNFLFGIPHWAVSVAAEDGEGSVQAGVVLDPVRAELFAAARGAGATLNGAPISVTERRDLGTALVGTGFSYRAEERMAAAELLPHLLPRVRDIRRAGAAALDLAWVACGRLDAFFESPIEWWDVAAGSLLVQEAGGSFGSIDDGRGCVASGRELFEPLAGLLAHATARRSR